MTQQPSACEHNKQALLQSLTQVGPSKPVGYLPLYTIEKFVQLSPEAVTAVARARGLATAQFGPSACCIKSGALYVYHRKALTTLLEENADAVCAAGLPLDPDSFVAHIATIWFESNHPAYPIVAAVFGDNS